MGRNKVSKLHIKYGIPLGALAAVLIVCTSCSTSPTKAKVTPATHPVKEIRATGMPAFYSVPDPLPAGPPGTIIRTQLVKQAPDVPAGTRIVRVLYKSTTIHGRQVAVSGYFMYDPKVVPKGGRPVIAWAHGTMGMANFCAPSTFRRQGPGQPPDLPEYLGTFLAKGFVIAATDYQGFGTPGVEPYLVGGDEGRDVLDSARAVLTYKPAKAKNEVVIMGHSQGGGSALFAGQLASSYAPNLHVIGVVANAPASSLALALEYHPTSDLIYIYFAAYAWTHTYKRMPSLDELLGPWGKSHLYMLDKYCFNHIYDAIIKTPVDQIFNMKELTSPVVIRLAKENSPGHVATKAPILINQGLADKTVYPFLSYNLVKDHLCPLHDTVEYREYPGATHYGVVTDSKSFTLAWIARRMEGLPAHSNCDSLPPSPGL